MSSAHRGSEPKAALVPSTETGAVTEELPSVLASVRKPRDEAQWTQLIASVCQQDAASSSRLVKAFLQHSLRAEAVQQLGTPPAALRCRAEVPLEHGSESLGRVDLIFDDPQGDYVVLVELKLGSQYAISSSSDTSAPSTRCRDGGGHSSPSPRAHRCTGKPHSAAPADGWALCGGRTCTTLSTH